MAEALLTHPFLPQVQFDKGGVTGTFGLLVLFPKWERCLSPVNYGKQLLGTTLKADF